MTEFMIPEKRGFVKEKRPSLQTRFDEVDRGILSTVPEALKETVFSKLSEGNKEFEEKFEDSLDRHNKAKWCETKLLVETYQEIMKSLQTALNSNWEFEVSGPPINETCYKTTIDIWLHRNKSKWYAVHAIMTDLRLKGWRPMYRLKQVHVPDDEKNQGKGFSKGCGFVNLTSTNLVLSCDFRVD